MPKQTQRPPKTLKRSKRSPLNPCLHRSVAQWPDSILGACTTCGQQMTRIYQDGQGFWQPLIPLRERRGSGTPTPAPTLWGEAE